MDKRTRHNSCTHACTLLLDEFRSMPANTVECFCLTTAVLWVICSPLNKLQTIPPWGVRKCRWCEVLLLSFYNRATIDLNVTSPIIVTSKFLRKFSSHTVELSVVNVSSLCAIQPTQSMAVYCTGKAARDMLHACLAEEVCICASNFGMRIYTVALQTKSRSLLKVLNYAPGPMDTAMNLEICNNCANDGIRQAFQDMRDKVSFLRDQRRCSQHPDDLLLVGSVSASWRLCSKTCHIVGHSSFPIWSTRGLFWY